MNDKLIGKYNKEIMTRSAFIKQKLDSYEEQLTKLLPAEGYELEYEDLFDNIREALC